MNNAFPGFLILLALCDFWNLFRKDVNFFRYVVMTYYEMVMKIVVE